MKKGTDFFANLRNLSEILIKENENLIPSERDFLDDLIVRSAELWRTYFSNGIMLSSGGVETSLFRLKQIMGYPDLKFFNEYPGSLNSYASLTQKLGKKFLKEEGLISSLQDHKELVIAYSLGSHEGLMRAARVIYRDDNYGIFIPIGSYGLTVSALKDLKPLSYKICFVNSQSHLGDKISLSHLELLIEQNPRIKTLFIEQKTTAGAVYTEYEINDIIKICKSHQLFLIVDSAHLHMEFEVGAKFPTVSHLCEQNNFHNYLVLFTGSKTYGLERARVGLVLFDRRNSYFTLDEMNDQFVRMFGTFSDLPVVATHRLMSTPIVERKAYVKQNVIKHRFNMNVMLAYIEGINSNKLDSDLKEALRSELPEEFWNGIKGLRIIYKPESGIHLKVDVSQFRKQYFYNIQLFNSEILCYVLNKICGIVTLHSFQITDTSGYSMRFSFSSKTDVHIAMQRMYEFFKSLTPYPKLNPFMDKVLSLDSFKDHLPTQVATCYEDNHVKKVSSFTAKL